MESICELLFKSILAEISNSAQLFEDLIAKGKLFVFEGVDATGKSAISSLFAEQMFISEPLTCLFSFPGKASGTIGELVYRIHHDPASLGLNGLTPLSLQALHIAAHLDAIESKIVPALEAGKTVVLDRYWWSTRVYGEAGGAAPRMLDRLIDAEIEAWGTWKPTALFYLSTPKPLREEAIDHWTELKTCYELLLERESGKYSIFRIENNKSVENTLVAITELLKR